MMKATQEKILIIDDSAKIRSFLSEMLRPLDMWS
jgi:CheY-like chemotaxis protein